MSTRLPVKDPSESVVVLFDFSREAASIAIGASPVTCEVQWTATEDLAPQNVLTGAAEISASSPAHVLQRVSGGVDLTDYALRCVGTSPSGDVLVVAAVLPVRKQPA